MNPLRELTGYSDLLGVKPGGSIKFMVSTSEPRFDAAVVKLICGDEPPLGPGHEEVEISQDLARNHPGRLQSCQTGSYLVADQPHDFMINSFTLQCWVSPTTPARGRVQSLMSRWCSLESLGYRLFIDSEGRLGLEMATPTDHLLVTGTKTLRRNTWYFVAATFAGDKGGHLYQRSMSPWDRRGMYCWSEPSGVGPELQLAAGVPFRVGAAGSCLEEEYSIADSFNGRIDTPTVLDQALDEQQLRRLAAHEWAPEREALYAQWYFADDQSTVRIADKGPGQRHARLVNMPRRAVTGHNWTSRESDFRLAPHEYGAIHFHEDDLEDARWTPDVEWDVPSSCESGVYALKLRAGDLTDYLPFVVEPSEVGSNADVVVLMPTFTYIAYANERVGDSMQRNTPADWPQEYDPLDRYLERHPEFGKSLYDVHEDLSGVTYSSALRPIPSLRPHYRFRILHAPRHLAGDLYLIDWLENFAGVRYDVTTDGDLHTRGAEALEGYRVLITGGHPEYWTTAMLDALETWVHKGGRLMYLGGNGFYWVTSVHPELPHVIEVRRGINGSRPWESLPGELHHSTTGELGGLWRLRGREPNRLLGVGFAAEGADGRSVGYRRAPLSYEDHTRWIFDGVDEEVIGDYGRVMGGAVGDEVDRADYEVGTPYETNIVASSLPLSAAYNVALEDATILRGPRQLGTPRADMAFLASSSGGAVFSVGSISWTGSLSHNRYQNNVSRITHNVLQRFREDVPFPERGAHDEPDELAQGEELN